MGARRILLPSAAMAVVCSVVYLGFLVDKKPDSSVDIPTKVEHKSPVRRMTANTVIRPRNKNQKPVPDYMLEALENPPKPFQARSEPAKARALFVGVETDEMAHRVSVANHKFRKRKYREAIEESIAILEEIPENQQLKRIVIRAACLSDRPQLAKEYMLQVSASDQHYLVGHCRTYGDPNDWPDDPPFGVRPEEGEPST